MSIAALEKQNTSCLLTSSSELAGGHDVEKCDSGHASGLSLVAAPLSQEAICAQQEALQAHFGASAAKKTRSTRKGK